MVFHLIGLGLDLDSLSKQALDICKRADKIYVETYTVDFPYKTNKLEQAIGKKIFPMTRIMVEGENFVNEAKNKNIILLVYGSPLVATTHISLILKLTEVKNEMIKKTAISLLPRLLEEPKLNTATKNKILAKIKMFKKNNWIVS